MKRTLTNDLRINDLLTGVRGSDSSEGLSLGVSEIRDRKRSLKCISKGSDSRLLGVLLDEWLLLLFRLLPFLVLLLLLLLLLLVLLLLLLWLLLFRFRFSTLFALASSLGCDFFLLRFALLARILTACQTDSLNSKLWTVLDRSILVSILLPQKAFGQVHTLITLQVNL